jgi:hypothetical protein
MTGLITPEQAAFEAFQAARAARNPMMPATAWTHPAVDGARDYWRAAAKAAIEADPDRAALYRERARLVAYLAACYPSEMTEDHEGDPWPVVFVLGPTGQMSWHIARADLDLFDHVGWHGIEPQWDGHTTEQKYERLAELIPHAEDGLAGMLELDALREQLAAATGALRDIKDSYDTGTAAHDWARKALDDIGGVKPAQPGEATRLREQLQGIREQLGNLASGMEMSARTSDPSKKSEIEYGCARAVRAIARTVK